MTRSMAMSTAVSSLRVLVKRRTGVGLRMSLSTSGHTVFPMCASALIGKIRVVSITGLSARLLGSNQHTLVARRCAIASFSSTLCCLPPVRIAISGRGCHSGTLTLGMCSIGIPLSPRGPRRFFNPGAIVRTPFT